MESRIVIKKGIILSTNLSGMGIKYKQACIEKNTFSTSLSRKE